jgi:hypothetical protein
MIKRKKSHFTLCTNGPGKKCLRNRTVRRQEEGKNSVYLFVFCMNLAEINALLTIFCCQMMTRFLFVRKNVSFNVSNSKRNWAKFGVGVKLIVILRHIIAYFSINIRWHSQNVSSDNRKWLIKHLFPPSSCKKQINKQNSYLLLAFLQSGSVNAKHLGLHLSTHAE